ncbi:MAG TPA: hypothetical protein VFW83_05405, partial [Bryobacteraceae bacterium]|nr:hypothetical protein [Bryobacteraceae bacterium]
MKLLLAFAILALGAASAQEKPALNARELFYTPPPQAATPSQAAAPAPAPVPKAVEKAKRPVRIARKTKKKAAPKEAAPAQEVAKSSPAPAPVPAPAPQAPSQFQQVALVSAVPLGLRYSILKRNSNGNYAEVDTDSTFHSG